MLSASAWKLAAGTNARSPTRSRMRVSRCISSIPARSAASPSMPLRRRGAKGRLAKNDRADARVIAEFMAKMVDRTAARCDRSLDILVEYLTVRHRLTVWMVDCTNTLEHLHDPNMRKTIEAQRKTVETALKKL